MKQALFVVSLMFVWIDACSIDAGNDTRAVKGTILRYTQLLAEGYATMDMTRLQEVATQEQAEKVFDHMAALGEGKLVKGHGQWFVSSVRVLEGDNVENFSKGDGGHLEKVQKSAK